MRFLILLLLITLSFTAVFVISARAYGQRTPPPPTYLDNGDCEPPCWFGIKPGVNERYQIDRLTYRWIEDRSVLFNSPYMARTNGPGDYMELFALHTDNSGLLFSDVLRQFGAPEGVGCQCRVQGGGSHNTIILQVYFLSNQLEVEVRLPSDSDWLMPDARVTGICYYARPVLVETVSWYGLSSLGRYPVCPDECKRDKCTYLARDFELEPPRLSVEAASE